MRKRGERPRGLQPPSSRKVGWPLRLRAGENHAAAFIWGSIVPGPARHPPRARTCAETAVNGPSLSELVQHEEEPV